MAVHLEKGIAGISVVVHLVKPWPWVLAAHVGTSSGSDSSTLIHVSANAFRKIAEDDLKIWAPVSMQANWKQLLYSGFSWPSSAISAIWVMNQQMEIFVCAFPFL